MSDFHSNKTSTDVGINRHIDQYSGTEDPDICLHSHSEKYTLNKGQPLKQMLLGKLAISM